MRKGWTETTLGDVVELGKGGAWGADEIEPNRVEAICLRGTDLADLIDKKHPEAPVRWLTPKELKKAVCSPNMVLIETSGSKCGRSVVLTSEMLSGFALPVVYSNFCRTLTIDTRLLSSRYVEMWFSHMYEAGVIPSYRATSAMPNLDVKSLLRMETIAVPPLVEQKRIVDVVSSVDAYIDALQQQSDSARKARSAVLHELLSAGGDDWTETTLGEVAIWGSGGTPKSGESAYYDGDIPWCVIGDLTEDEVFLTEKCITSEGLKNSSAKIVEPGAVLIAMYGASIGRTGIVGRPMATNQAIAFAYPIVGTLDSRFLLLFLQTQKLQFVEAGHGAAQPNISQTVLKAWPIILPPLDEQKRIAEIVSAMDDVIQSTEQAVVEAKNLRSGLLSDLLSGNHEIPASYDSLLGAA